MAVYAAFYMIHFVIFAIFRYDLYQWAYLEEDSFESLATADETLYDYCCYTFTALDPVSGLAIRSCAQVHEDINFGKRVCNRICS